MCRNVFVYAIPLYIFLNIKLCTTRKVSVNETDIDSDDEVYNVIKLRDFLLKNPRYDRLARPVKHHSTTVQVSVALFLSKITELEISTGILTVQASFLLKWKDEHLVWDSEKFGGITKLVFGYREIWTPEITHWSSFDSKSYISRTFDRQSMDVKNDGTVEWFPTATLKSHCTLDLKNFPSDTQTCHQSIGTWNQNTSEVNLVDDDEYSSTDDGINGPIYVSKRFKSQEWDVAKLNMERYEVHGDVTNDNFSAFDIAYTLKRKGSIYSCYILIPYLVASSLFLSSFSLPIQSVLRLVFGGLSVVTLVLLSFFLGMVLGNHSLEVPYSLKCIAVNMFLVSICMAWNQVCCSFLENIPERFSSLPACFMKIITNHYVSKIFCLSERKKYDENYKADEIDSDSIQVTTSGITEFPTMDRSNPSKDSVGSSLNVMDINLSTKDKSVSGDREKEDGKKLHTQNVKRVIQDKHYGWDNSWTTFFSFVDRLLLLVYIATLLIFHS